MHRSSNTDAWPSRELPRIGVSEPMRGEARPSPGSGRGREGRPTSTTNDNDAAGVDDT